MRPRKGLRNSAHQQVETWLLFSLTQYREGPFSNETHLCWSAPIPHSTMSLLVAGMRIPEAEVLLGAREMRIIARCAAPFVAKLCEVRRGAFAQRADGQIDIHCERGGLTVVLVCSNLVVRRGRNCLGDGRGIPSESAGLAQCHTRLPNASCGQASGIHFTSIFSGCQIGRHRCAYRSVASPPSCRVASCSISLC